ncbi:hypothetical protein NHH88_06880 [Oxalobacteraceae bacterium OTU3CAMAD1]|nr:hypothetical protein NHH88_06880 [Oxalobacteraceae bacterium OTU3CAMAD1]
MLRVLRSSGFFAAALFALATYLLHSWVPIHNGDVAEYTLTTLAIANHGTPDIRPSDIEDGRRRLPELAPLYANLERDMNSQSGELNMPFARGLGGRVYAIHFFAYSALAAVPFKLLPLAGIDPFKCYLAVNLACIAMLGLALRRLLGDNLKAVCALGLFLGAGVWWYLRWSSPEVMSAAALLSALILFCTGAPLRAGLLASIGAMQNPSIVLAFGFMPLLRLALRHTPGQPWRARLADAVQGWRGAAGMAAGTLLALSAPLWNQIQFGTPSIIGKIFTRSYLFTWARLHSLFFDLSQGMLIGIPAIAALLLAWGWAGRRDGGGAAWRLLGACAAMTLALVLPALPVINWNSGAQGIMRYAVWAAMPLLFALVWQMHGRRGWRWLVPVLVVLGLQAGVTRALGAFRYVEFSPLAKRVMEHAPGLYNPDPELFAERTTHVDEYFKEPEIYLYRYKGVVTKALYHISNPGVAAALCGPGSALAADNALVDASRGWRYVNGPVKCVPAAPK